MHPACLRGALSKVAISFEFCRELLTKSVLNTSSTRKRVHFFRHCDALACASSLYSCELLAHDLVAVGGVISVGADAGAFRLVVKLERFGATKLGRFGDAFK